MQVDWGKLAEKVGAVNQYGSSFSRAAIEIILGEDFFVQAVENAVNLEDGYNLSEGVLKILSPLGMRHCYDIVKNSTNLEKRRSAAFLLQYFSDRDVLNYIPELLADPDKQIQSSVIYILDRVRFYGLIHQEDVIQVLESAVNHPNEEIRKFAIGEVSGETILGMDDFIKNLVDALWEELYEWKRRLKFETIHGFDLRCIPWYGQIKLSFLTSQEDFELSEAYSVGDWDTSWRLDDLPCSGYKIEAARQWMQKEFEKSGNSLQCLEVFLEACGTALKSSSVQDILNEYKISQDFQITLFNINGAKPWKNYYRV